MKRLRYVLSLRVMAAIFGLCALASNAQSEALQSQQRLDVLKDQFLSVSGEVKANFAKLKEFESKNDRPAYCQAMKAMMASQDDKVDVLHRINDIMKNEPATDPENATFMAEEETKARQGQASLETLNRANCTQVAGDIPDLEAVFNQMTAAESSGKQHLKAGLALIEAGDKLNGCAEMRAGLKDYQLQLDAAHLLQSAFEKNPKVNSDELLQFQRSTQSLETNVSDIKAYVDVACSAK